MTSRRIPLMARTDRLCRAHDGAWVIRIAASGAAAATLLLYFVRAAKKRRSETTPVPESVPVSQSDAIHDDPDFWEKFDEFSPAEAEVNYSPGPLVQLEASLAETKKDEGIAREGSRVPASIEFVKHLMTLPAPEIDATHRSFYFLRPATWRFPIRFRSDHITKGNLMARLSASSRLLGRHPILNGLALFLTATSSPTSLLAECIAPNSKAPTRVRSRLRRTHLRQRPFLRRERYAISTTPPFERASEPPPPAEGPPAAIAPAPPSKAQPSPSSKSNRRIAQTHRSRHRVTAVDKARAFFRRLF